MSRLAKVGGARVGRKVRPESVDDLLPLQPLPRRQGEQLHELGGAPLLPCPSGNATPIDRHLEPTEDADLEPRHPQRILPTTSADKRCEHHADAAAETLGRGVASQCPFRGQDGGQPQGSARLAAAVCSSYGAGRWGRRFRPAARRASGVDVVYVVVTCRAGCSARTGAAYGDRRRWRVSGERPARRPPSSARRRCRRR
jgi:hypothetical protein